MSTSSHFQEQEHGDRPQEDLATYFNKSVSAVQLYADRFEHDVVRPAFSSSQAFFKERPITAAFVAIFSLLSFLPVLSFVGAFIFAAGGVLLIALLATVFACGTALITFLSLLLFILFVNFLTSLFLTGAVTFAYVLLRLAMLIRERGSAGISYWIVEIQDFILTTTTINSAVPNRSPAYLSDTDTMTVQGTPVSQSSRIKDEK